MSVRPCRSRQAGRSGRLEWRPRRVVGDYVLDRLFDIGSPPRDFGIDLNNATIEKTLKKQRIEQAAYRQRFPDEVAALQALVQTAIRNSTSPRQTLIILNSRSFLCGIIHVIKKSIALKVRRQKKPAS